jgi:hypothetical protein
MAHQKPLLGSEISMSVWDVEGVDAEKGQDYAPLLDSGPAASDTGGIGQAWEKPRAAYSTCSRACCAAQENLQGCGR